MFHKKSRIESQSTLDLFRGKPCEICKKPSDPCHIKSQGSGGDDVEYNLISLCRAHHVQSHAIGWLKFSDRHERVKTILSRKGWSFDDFGKLTRF